eukprot:GILK01002202.1.p1 GENE.GILK01002202.1~~GILK01002202.1.p1  ORF type:complete len:371 (+),score=71.20 GILK01002202.1:58-1113(+)
MGTCGSKSNSKGGNGGGETTKEAPQKKVYSWETRTKNPADYVLSKRKGEVIVKEPGSIAGEQFVIEECEDCDIFLCDYSAAISIDYCTGCRFFVGPVASSAFVRNTSNCKLVLACQQFRSRECTNLDILLFSSTQPVIETSKNMKFGCFNYFYFNLKEQFDAANLSIWNNKWSEIYDFNPDLNRPNFELLSTTVTYGSLLKPLATVATFCSEEELQYNGDVIPQTWGNRLKPSNQFIFVLFFPEHTSQALDFVDTLRTKGSTVVVRTRELRLDRSQADTIFANENNKKPLSSAALTGSVVCLEINGDTSRDIVTNIVNGYNSKITGPVPAAFLSTDPTMCSNVFETWKETI